MKTSKIAKLLKMHESTLCNKIQGRRRIFIEDAEKLTEAFGKDPVFWMKGTPKEIKEVINKIA